MTVVAGLIKGTDVYMAGDGCASNSLDYVRTNIEKIFYVPGRHDIVLGGAGSIRMLNLLQVCAKAIFSSEEKWNVITQEWLILNFIPALQELASDLDEDASWEILIAVKGYPKGHLYKIQQDFGIIEASDKDFAAIGSGYLTASGCFETLSMLRSQGKKGIPWNENALEIVLESCTQTLCGVCPPYTYLKAY